MGADRQIPQRYFAVCQRYFFTAGTAEEKGLLHFRISMLAIAMGTSRLRTLTRGTIPAGGPDSENA